MMVSVIIPNYNHAPFLKERIESVLNQTYQDYEVIILDDCSLDNSREIIEQYRINPKVSHIVYNETNSGSTFIQWNKGFSIAKGNYIWIAESDDCADPTFLESLMVHLLKDASIVLGFSSVKFIDADSNFIANHMGSSIMRDNVESGDYFIKHNMLVGNNIINASSVIFKKEALLKVPLDYISYKSAGDYLFWIEILRQGKVYHTGKPLDYFRQHNQKVTPRSIISGVTYFETYKIYKRLMELPYINKYHKMVMIGSSIRTIKQYRRQFKNETIYTNLISIWRRETSSLKLSLLILNFDRGLRLFQRLVLKNEIPFNSN